MNSVRIISDIDSRSLLWAAFLFSVGAGVSLLTRDWWWATQTLSYSLWAAMVGFVIASLVPVKGTARNVLRVSALAASAAVLYDPLNLLPRISLTNNVFAWVLLGCALSGEDAKTIGGRKAAGVVVLLIASALVFLLSSWMRIAPAARKMPDWTSLKAASQTLRVFSLYSTVVLIFLATRIGSVNSLAGRRGVKWLLGAVCLAFAVMSFFYGATFFRNPYNALQFLLQPLFLYAVAKMLRLLLHAPSGAAVSKPGNYDVFISYRKDGGSELADLVRSNLLLRGYARERIFLDTHSLSSGDFREKISQAVQASANLVLIVSKDCFKDLSEDSAFLFEIKTALESGVNIVPVCFSGPEELSSEFLPDIAVKSFRSNAVIYSHDYQQASFDRLKSFLVTARKPFPWRTLLMVAAVLVLMAVSWVMGSRVTPNMKLPDVDIEFLSK